MVVSRPQILAIVARRPALPIVVITGSAMTDELNDKQREMIMARVPAGRPRRRQQRVPVVRPLVVELLLAGHTHRQRAALRERGDPRGAAAASRSTAATATMSLASA